MPFIKGEERNHWFVWAVGCLLLLSALLVHLNTISNLLEVYGAMRKVGITSVVVQAESSPPQQHPEKKKP